MTHGFSKYLVAAGLVISQLVLIAPSSVSAQDKKQPSSPVGGSWDSKVSEPAGQKSRTLSSEQMKSIDTINSYFNKIGNMKGSFSQTNPDKKVQRGQFYLMRPGRFRFDYNRPSRQIIVSDGTYLAIQDLDLKNEDVYGLENTPFRILLRDNVDLLRDARIVAVQQSDSQIAVTITDKSPDSPGQITIYLKAQPEPQLAGWVTKDVQGGVTKVEVSNLKRPKKLNKRLFEREKLYREAIR